MTSLGFLKTLEIVAPEERPRSTMATVIGVGVGVAAAAFLVSSSASHGRKIKLIRAYRGERAWWHSENIAVGQPLPASWARLFTKAALNLR